MLSSVRRDVRRGVSVLLILVVWGAAACAPVVEVTGTAASAAATATIAVPAATHTPFPSSSASPTSTAAPVEPTAPTPAEPDVPVVLAEMCSPLSGYSFDELTQIVSSPFIAPRPGKDDGHHGTDFAHYQFGDRTTIAGEPVAAMFDGLVAAAITASWPYGNFVIIETGVEGLPDGFVEAYDVPTGASVYHLYAHLEDPPGLAIGEHVDCGEIFGLVGNSGWSGNYHLHLEIRLGPSGAVFKSMAYYLTTTTVDERANYESWRFGGDFVPVDPVEVIEIAKIEAG